MWQGLLSKVFKVREKVALNLGKPDEEKPFLDHLDDLRSMLVRMAVTLLVSTLVTFGFNQKLTDLVQQPYVWGMSSAKTTITEAIKADPTIVDSARPEFSWKMPGTRTPQEGFMASVNVSLVAAVICSFPFLLLFLLQFILPGLRDAEKKVLFPGLAIGFGLFLTGIFFSYYMVLPRALSFFAEWNFWHGFENTWMLGDYIIFATRFILIFGVSFELPVVIMALVKLDFLSYKVMKTTRKHAIVGIAIFSAVITPTQDVLTLMLLAGPLYFLYEICIWLAYFMEKKDRESYPEYYAEKEQDEAALEKESTSPDDWENDYNPWDQSENDREEDEDYKRSKSQAETPAETPGEPSAEAERSATESPATDAGTPSDSEAKPQSEKSDEVKPDTEPKNTD